MAVQLVRHTPRLERRLHPSVHVEQLEDKVTACGSVLSVGHPQRRPRCAFLSFKVMVRSAPAAAHAHHAAPATLRIPHTTSPEVSEQSARRC